MIKEELESRAREYLAEHSEYSEVFGQTFVAVDTLTAMVDFAEPREKQIEIDAEQIRALQKQNGELSDKVKELEQKLEQTEKDLADYQFNYPAIKELQKENAELKTNFKIAKDNEYEYQSLLNKANEEIAELKRYSEQLKLQIQRKEKCLSKQKSEKRRIANRVNKDKRRLIRRKRESSDMLTKAKEIIKKLYPFVRDKCYTTTLSENKERQSLITEAEQFLKEIKEK